MSERKVTLDFEDAQRIFDLAVGADAQCSDWMDLDDVRSMRRLAEALGVDPATCTGDEFVAQFPHPFTPETRSIDELRRPVAFRRTTAPWYWDTRPETDEETIARIGSVPGTTCEISRWKGRCGKPESDPIHQAREAAEMGA